MICQICNNEVVRDSNSQKYCLECSQSLKIQREKNRKRDTIIYKEWCKQYYIRNKNIIKARSIKWYYERLYQKNQCKDCGKAIKLYSIRCTSCSPKANPSKSMLGKKHSWKTRKLMSKKAMGKNNHMFGKHTSKRQKEVASERFSGEKHPMWKGGISFEPYPIIFNKKFKEFIRNRQNRICFSCDIEETKLIRKLYIHHIDYDKNNMNLNNCMALCNICHGLTNWNRDFWKQVLTEGTKQLLIR